MEKIDYNDITQLNIELFRSKLYFRLRLKDETTGCIEPQGNCACEGQTEAAGEKIRDYFMEKGFWTVFSDNLCYFQLEKMEGEFESWN